MASPGHLAILIARIGAEVAATADDVGDIRVGSEPGTTNGSALSHADIVDLQKLDLIEQTLRSLASLLDGIAVADIGTLDTDGLLDKLPLSDLADRLRGMPAPTEPDSGTLDLF